MTLDDLTEDIEETYESLDLGVDLDEGTRRELTMLLTALDEDDADDMLEEAVSLLFRSTVESGKLDFHLRSAYDVWFGNCVCVLRATRIVSLRFYPKVIPREPDIATMTLVGSLRYDPHLRRPAVASLLLLTVVLLGDQVLAVVFADIGDTGLPALLPQFGTIGQTVTYYLLFVDTLKFIALAVTLLWLAYAYGRHRATGPAN